MNEIKAPTPFAAESPPLVFIAGSIEMGIAENWQDATVFALEDLQGTILNPRRDDWDSSWKQSIDNPQFHEQVEWELDAKDQADIVGIYFSPGTESPITLLELGLSVGSNPIVYCPEGFWRKGNVDIVCLRHGLLNTNSFSNFIFSLRARIKSWQ